MTLDNETRTGERIIKANGVDLCIQAFGEPGDPAILLIAGASGSMDWWEDEFCQRLADGERYVIRYDSRDTGRSMGYKPGAPEYTSRDLAGDVIGILDALGIATVHLAGLSMGGGIAQAITLTHPERVATLTLFSTTIATPHQLDLPPMADRLRAAFNEPSPEPDWTDRKAVIDYVVEGERPFAGSIPFDAAHAREIAGRVVDRTTNMASSMTNHFVAEPGEPIRAGIEQIAVPALVVHGSDDPLFPIAHGVALAREIPDARLLVLEGGGHEYPRRQFWDTVVPAILEHTAPASSPSMGQS